MRNPLTEHQYIAPQMTYRCRSLEGIAKELGTSEAQVYRTLRRIRLGILLDINYLQPPVFENEQQMGVPHALH
ncbi:hypothetical protein [Acidithiobacillus sp.]|jgi:hypothetical protein|uniref:hypothetical protein n=1 Tax=Acidithiobacillus sp. TaxID=1872118 RepID=UPI0035693335